MQVFKCVCVNVCVGLFVSRCVCVCPCLGGCCWVVYVPDGRLFF